MAEVEMTKVSSRGQIVIPQEIREKIHLKEGEAFAVTASKDTLLLKRVRIPSKEEILKEWERLNREGKKQVKRLGIKQKNVVGLIHKARGIKE